MIINHENYIPDQEFLQKYALRPLSGKRALADQVLIMYLHWKSLPIPLFLKEPLMDISSAQWFSQNNTERAQFDECKNARLKESGFESYDPIVNGLLALSTLGGPANEAYPDVCERIDSIPREEFRKDYPWLLITLFEQSHLWADNGYCPFEMVEKLKQYLDGLECEVEIGPESNPFISAVFCEDEPDEDNTFALVFRDALPKDLFFLPSDSPTCQRVLIDTLYNPDIGWGPMRYEDRYDGIDKIVYLSSKPDSIDGRLIEAWMEFGLLWGVIDTLCFCRSTGSLGRFLILDRINNDQSVHFLRTGADGIVDDEKIGAPVPYDVIESFGYSLNPVLYTKPDNPLGLPLVALEDLCEIDTKRYRNLVPLGTHLPYYDFTNDFKRLCFNASHPRVDAYESESASALCKGPHVHLSIHSGTAFVSHTPGAYHYQQIKSIALRVKDNRVSEEYLAYALTRDLSFRNFLLSNQGEGLLRRKIAIHPDRSKQDELIEGFKQSLEDDMLSSNYYNLIWIDTAFDNETIDKLTAELEEKQIGVKWLSSVLDPDNGLEATLGMNGNRTQAVVIDAGVEAVKDRLKGLRMALSLCRKAKIPIYVYTDVDHESISDDLQDEEFAYLSDGRLFHKEGATNIGKLVAAIRRELDEKNDVSAEVRSAFNREFKAAEWLDDFLSRHGIHLVSDLSRAVLQPNESLNIVRGILNSLCGIIIKLIGDRTSQDVLSLGSIPDLLDDNVYFDKYNSKLQFVIKGRVLPRTLARSLRLAKDVANGASHSEQSDESLGRLNVTEYFSVIQSENISWAIIRIVMDLFLYLRMVECRFDARCEACDPFQPLQVDWVGVVRKTAKGYCCETDSGSPIRIEYYESSPPAIERTIRISKVYRERKFVDLYQWYVKKDDWAYV